MIGYWIELLRSYTSTLFISIKYCEGGNDFTKILLLATPRLTNIWNLLKVIACQVPSIRSNTNEPS